MKLSVGWNVAIQITLLVIGILLPAFIPMTSAQQSAITTFVSAVQVALGIRGYYLTPSGEQANAMPTPQPPPAAPK
jgi:hypothetical protein